MTTNEEVTELQDIEELLRGISPQFRAALFDAYAPEKLFTIDETAEVLNVPRRNLDNWRWQKIGPPWIKIAGRTIRYRVSDLMHWLDEQTVKPCDSQKEESE